MTIEIVDRVTCPTCGGTGKETLPAQELFGQQFPRQRVACCNCEVTGTVPRVLATFADAAALRGTIIAAIRDSRNLGYDEIGDDADAVLTAEGVTDD